jgi:hypothetical protein
MPVTLRDGGRGAPPVKRNIASLVGGVVIAAGCFILWMLVAGELLHAVPGPATIAAGVVVAVMIGIWIRLADL